MHVYTVIHNDIVAMIVHTPRMSSMQKDTMDREIR